MTSELLNALNPDGIQTRLRAPDTTYGTLQPISSSNQFQQVTLRRSNEDVAVPQAQVLPPRPSHQSTHAVHELLRILQSTRESQEIERQRRLVWEQDIEAKYAQRQAEMERTVFEMQQQIADLRKFIHDHPTLAMDNGMIVAGECPTRHGVDEGTTPLLLSSPAILPVSPHQQSVVASAVSDTVTGLVTTPAPENSETAPSPDLHSQQEDETMSETRKRSILKPPSHEDGLYSDAESSKISHPRPPKRVNHHDARCLTIQHAMRSHILHVMQIESDKDLPDSHIEGAPLGPEDPVRFVWEKTPKQSVHNGRMKKRVLEDLKAYRALYEFVPEKQFNKKILDSVFDQAFITLRQKYRAQRDAMVAVDYKKKEDLKALRARRLSRKKTKLANRSEARNRLEVFEHVIFDGALQIDCMSSEESDGEDSAHGGCLRVRGFAWRSSRLQRFFDALDNEDKFDRSLKPKRGVGRKERYVGPPKDGFPLPPKGVADWMISKTWLRSIPVIPPKLLDAIKDIVIDPPGFKWETFHNLGSESEDEASIYVQNETQHYIPHHNTSNISSSLHYALAHVS